MPGSDALALALDEDPNSRTTFASPPCFMHELDRGYLGLESRSGAPEPADSAAQCDGVGGSGPDGGRSVTTRPEGPGGR